MNTKEKEIAIRKELEGQDLLTVKSLMNVNYKPHPYTIGAAHVAYASKNHGGMLGDETCRNVRCAHPGCYLSYEEHTSDLVCFFQITRDCKGSEINNILKPMTDKLGTNFIDGFGFVETEEKFRIL